MIRRLFAVGSQRDQEIHPGDLLVLESVEGRARVRRVVDPAEATHVAEDKPDEFNMVAARRIARSAATDELAALNPRDTLEQRVANTRPLDLPAPDAPRPIGGGTTLLGVPLRARIRRALRRTFGGRS